MLFLALLIYLIAFPVTAILLWPLVWRSLPKVILALPTAGKVVGGFGLAFFAALFLVWLLGTFNPPARDWLGRLTRNLGVRKLCLVSAAALVYLVVLEITQYHPPLSPVVFWGALLPGLAVFVLNALGIDITFDQPEKEPEKVILPEKEMPGPLQEIVRDYQWQFRDKSYRERLVIRRRVYEDFRSRERVLDTTRWARVYVTEGVGGETHEMARLLFKQNKPYGTYEEVEFVLAFVQQCIRYEADPEGTEYPRYPVETLADGKGDCEDSAILGAAILKCMGYDVALLFLPGHAALGVAGAEGVPGTWVEKDGVRYYYCEMTAEGWQIGQLPERYATAMVVVSVVPPLEATVVRPKEERAAA